MMLFFHPFAIVSMTIRLVLGALRKSAEGVVDKICEGMQVMGGEGAGLV
jgi:hypothetical protein